MLVLFDSLVSDWWGLVICCFRVALHRQCRKLQLPLAIFDSLEELGVNSNTFRTYAEQLAQQCPEQLNVEEFTEDVEQTYERCKLTIKPRVGALEWIMLQLDTGKEEVILVSHEPEFAEQLILIWSSTIGDQDKIASEKLSRLKCHPIPSTGENMLTRNISIKGSKIVGRLQPPRELSAPKISSTCHKSIFPLSQKAWRRYRNDGSLIPGGKLKGKVVHGWQRGSKHLGCPTANLNVDINFGDKGFTIPGVYAGIATLHNAEFEGLIIGTAINVGYAPTYDNPTPTIEAHLLHEFAEDFYDAEISIKIFGLIRAEGRYTDFGELLDVIQMDCESLCDMWHMSNRFGTDDHECQYGHHVELLEDLKNVF